MYQLLYKTCAYKIYKKYKLYKEKINYIKYIKNNNKTKGSRNKDQEQT